MNRQSSKFSLELRKRTVQMVLDHQGEYSSQWVAIESIAGKTGCTAQTLRNWVRQHEVDTGGWEMGDGRWEMVFPVISRHELKPWSER